MGEKLAFSFERRHARIVADARILRDL